MASQARDEEEGLPTTGRGGNGTSSPTQQSKPVRLAEVPGERHTVRKALSPTAARRAGARTAAASSRKRDRFRVRPETGIPWRTVAEGTGSGMCISGTPLLAAERTEREAESAQQKVQSKTAVALNNGSAVRWPGQI